MKLILINVFTQVKMFAYSNAKNIAFTCLFYSFWVVINYLTHTDFELKHFNNRMVGISTINAYDVSVRVSLFYKSIAILLGCFSVFSLIGFLINKLKNNFLNSNEAKIINYCSLVGLFYFFIGLFNFNNENCVEFVYFMHKLMIGALIIASFKKGFKKNISISVYAIITSLSVALYYIVADLTVIFGATTLPDFLFVTYSIAIINILLTHFYLSSVNTYPQKINLVAYGFVPIAFAPFLSILKDEIFLIFSGHNIKVQPFLVYLLLLSFLIITVMLRLKKGEKNLEFKNNIMHSKLVGYYYFPILIFSLICYQLYSYTITVSSDQFEAGNKYLPIMEFNKWGVIPIFEKYNSHLLSDFFYSSIYTFFNGMHANDIELYDFLTDAVHGVLYYYLIYFISRNAYIALFSVLLFPFYNAICPNEHAYIIFCVFILFKLIEQKPLLKNYILLFVSIIFLFFWKIDVGFACIIIMPLILLLYVVLNKKIKINYKQLLKAFTIVIGSFLLILTFICVYRNINVFKNAFYALNYLSSAQSYGYPLIGHSDLQSYKMHYFIFPVIVLIIVFCLLFKHRQLNSSKNQRLGYLSLLVICFYYIINFQRGLVRHSLIEGIDSYTSSFIYIILSLSIFVFLYKKKIITKYLFFCLISFFTLTNYKYPSVVDSKPIFELNFIKIKQSILTKVTEVNHRTVYKDSDTLNKNLIRFLKSNLRGDETFIDFTNQPMLYYYTQKITPSYFYQNPVCSHNDFLQERFIKDLKNYTTPYLIFSKYNNTMLFDNFPDCFTHYKMVEYFCTNYKPYLVIDNLCVWKKNNVATIQQHQYQADSISDGELSYDIKKLPFIWGSYDQKLKTEVNLFKYTIATIINPAKSDTIVIPSHLNKFSGNTIVLHIKNDSESVQSLKLSIATNAGKPLANFIFEINPSKNEEKYAIRVSSCYKWYFNNIKKIIFTSNSNHKIHINKLLITKAN